MIDCFKNKIHNLTANNEKIAVSNRRRNYGQQVTHTLHKWFHRKLIDVFREIFGKGMATIAANLDRMVTKAPSPKDKHKELTSKHNPHTPT
jgi:hypothetical protein